MKEKEDYMVSIKGFQSNIYSMVLAGGVKLWGGGPYEGCHTW